MPELVSYCSGPDDSDEEMRDESPYLFAVALTLLPVIVASAGTLVVHPIANRSSRKSDLQVPAALAALFRELRW